MTLLRAIHFAMPLVSLTLGLMVFYKNKKRPANLFFLILTLFLGVWLFFMAAAFQSNNAAASAFFIRATNAAAVCIPYIFDCLRRAVARPHSSFRSVLFHNRTWLLISALMAGMCMTRFFLRDVIMPQAQSASHVPEPLYGPGIILFGLYFLTTLISLIYLYYRDIRASSGIQRTELQFIMLSWATGTVLGLSFSVMLPVITGHPQAVQFLPITAVCIIGVIAYGIATRRIMAVADVLRRLTAYLLLLAYLIGLYIAVVYLVSWITAPFNWQQYFAHMIAALALALSMTPAHGLMQHVAYRLFINVGAIDVAQTLQDTNRLIASISTRDELINQFAKLVSKAVGTDHVLIFLSEGGSIIQCHPPRDAQRFNLAADDPLILTIIQIKRPLVLDSLQRIEHGDLETRAGETLKMMNAALAAGIFSKAALKGILLLGPRLSGRIYGATEQSALQVLCNQLAVGLENADLYTQVKDSAIYNDLLLDNIVTGIVAVNREGRITTCNREAHRILNAPPGSMLNRDVGDLPAPLAHALRATLSHGGSSRSVETALKINAHDERPVRFSTAPFSSHTGKQLGAFLVMEDLTALKKLEHQVRRTDRLASIGTLSAGMAHEIKNPLVTLKTFTQLLPERYQDADFRDTFSSLVGQEVKRIDSIVNQLLRFARPAKPSLHPIRIHEVLDNTLRLVHQQLKQKQIQLVREYEAPNDLIQGDNDLLVQAFLNFYLNAIDAMEQGGILTIRTDFAEIETNQLSLDGGLVTDTRLRVAIRDNGIGIKAEDIPHVFDPFFTTKSTGTGLGLSVSHGIIHEHHGVMDVESHLGRGSTFYILFPIATAEAPV